MSTSITVQIDQIPYADFKPNSILVIRVNALTFEDEEMVDRLTGDLRAKLDPSIDVLLLRDGFEVELLSEQVMNSSGWYRR